MGITPGSWWVNKRTGQKMAVADPRSIVTEHTKVDGKWVKRGLGRPPDRFPCFLEGVGLFLAWLAEDELRSAWKLLRLKPDEAVLPGWVVNAHIKDFWVYDKPIRELSHDALENGYRHHLSLMRVRSGWLCLVGMSTHTRIDITYAPGQKNESRGNFNWGIQKFATMFLPISEAVPRMRPRYERLRKTVYDHIAEGGAVGE